MVPTISLVPIGDLRWRNTSTLDEKTIENRELIYNTLKKFCDENNRCFLYDPSILLQQNNSLFDGDTHFNSRGFNESFKFLYDNFLIHNSNEIS